MYRVKLKGPFLWHALSSLENFLKTPSIDDHVLSWSQKWSGRKVNPKYQPAAKHLNAAAGLQINFQDSWYLQDKGFPLHSHESSNFHWWFLPKNRSVADSTSPRLKISESKVDSLVPLNIRVWLLLRILAGISPCQPQREPWCEAGMWKELEHPVWKGIVQPLLQGEPGWSAP